MPVTYLWGNIFQWGVSGAEDPLTTASTWPRPWNLAKRLMMENLSKSWLSILTSKIAVFFSNLKEEMRRSAEDEPPFNHKKSGFVIRVQETGGFLGLYGTRKAILMKINHKNYVFQEVWRPLQAYIIVVQNNYIS